MVLFTFHEWKWLSYSTFSNKLSSNSTSLFSIMYKWHTSPNEGSSLSLMITAFGFNSIPSIFIQETLQWHKRCYNCALYNYSHPYKPSLHSSVCMHVNIQFLILPINRGLYGIWRKLFRTLAFFYWYTSSCIKPKCTSLAIILITILTWSSFSVSREVVIGRKAVALVALVSHSQWVTHM